MTSTPLAERRTLFSLFSPSYFNSDDMQTGSFSDFTGGDNAGGEKPDFGGSIPGDFDPSGMPVFGRRKDN